MQGRRWRHQPCTKEDAFLHWFDYLRLDFLGADLLLFISSSNSAILLEDVALLASNSMPVDFMAEYTSLASAAYSSSGIMDLRATMVHFNSYENHV